MMDYARSHELQASRRKVATQSIADRASCRQ